MTSEPELTAAALEARLLWSIGTGGVQVGERLPSLRKGARQWSTSVHVVREAYRRLAAAGLIEIHQGSVARVSAPVRAGNPALEVQVRRFIREMAATQRVSPAEVLAAMERQVHATLPSVTVVECSMTLADSIARQLRRRWRVRTALHRLGDGAVPAGALVSTWFHRRDLRIESRREGAGVSLVRLQPSAETVDQVRRWTRLRPGLAVTVLETDPALAANVSRVLGVEVDGAAFETRIAAAGLATQRALTAVQGAFCLVSPRHWDALSDEQRLQPGIALLDYSVVADDLVAVGVAQEWLPAGGGR